MRTKSIQLTETGDDQGVTPVEANDGVTIYVTANEGAFSIQPKIGPAQDALFDEGSAIDALGKTHITGKVPFIAFDGDTIGTSVDITLVW